MEPSIARLGTKLWISLEGCKAIRGGFYASNLGAVLKACAELLDLEKGRQVHAFAYRHRYPLDLYLCNALIGMYAKCGCFINREALFFIILKKRDRKDSLT